MTDSPSVAGRMESIIQGWEFQADRRAIFLRCYYLMTRQMLVALDGGEFHDAGWVRNLLDRFADYYFLALEAYEQARSNAPAVWVEAHESARREETQVLQNLLLGVNAHINFDLVLTLVDMLGPEWQSLEDRQRQQRYEDHCHVNEIIGRTINSVQDLVIESLDPGMDIVDKFMGPLDEWVIEALISRWREEVWDHAMRMIATDDPGERMRQRESIERTTMERARTILLEGGVTDLARLL